MRVVSVAQLPNRAACVRWRRTLNAPCDWVRSDQTKHSDGTELSPGERESRMQIYLAAVSRAGRRAVRHRCSRSFVPVVSPVCHTISSVLSSSRRQSAGVITSHSHRVHGSRYWSFLTGWSRHVRLHHSLENSIHRTHRSLHIRCTVRAHRRDSCSESRQVPDHRSYGRTKKKRCRSHFAAANDSSTSCYS